MKMKFLKYYEQFVHPTDNENNPLEESANQTEIDKMKTKEEAEEEEDEAMKKAAAGFLDSKPMSTVRL